MKAVQVSEEKLKKPKRNSLLCCLCCTDGSEKILSNENLNEPYEYIVEKLVIKRVPVKQYATEADIKRKLSNLTISNNGSCDKSVITLTSYCQIAPKTNKELGKNEKASSDLIHKLEESMKSTDRNNGSLIPKTPLTPPFTEIRIQETDNRYPANQSEDKSSKNKVTAQIHKVPMNLPSIRKPSKCNPGEVLFVKQMSCDTSPIQQHYVEPALKETIEKLATKKQLKNTNRRIVHRDPNTGQMKEIFKNVKIDEPLKLEKVYNGNDAKHIDTSSDNHSSRDLELQRHTNQRSPKWKIIIKHKNDSKVSETIYRDNEKHATATSDDCSDFPS